LSKAVPVPPATKWLEPQVLTGAQASAHAMRQAGVEVFPVYPITPQTPIIETFSGFVADGKTDAVLLQVESEHSAMSAAVASALGGARTMTATASQGLAFMVEVIHQAAGMRAPIVMVVGNRALAAPISIHCDYSDSMLARDSGVVQIYSEDAQEAYNLTVMAPRIAEHPDVLLPVMVCMDGFTITHSAEVVSLLPDADVADFVGPYELANAMLTAGQATTRGVFTMPDHFFTLHNRMTAATETAATVYDEVARDFERRFGSYLGPVEAYRMEDAERAIVMMGAASGTVKEVIDEMRDAGERVGLVVVRLFRPFPRAALIQAIGQTPHVAVLDRASSPGTYPPLFVDAFATLLGAGDIRCYLYGIGGYDLKPQTVRSVYEELKGPRHEYIRYLGPSEED